MLRRPQGPKSTRPEVGVRWEEKRGLLESKSSSGTEGSGTDTSTEYVPIKIRVGKQVRTLVL